jgi:hypothetical protein
MVELGSKSIGGLQRFERFFGETVLVHGNALGDGGMIESTRANVMPPFIVT